MTNDPLHVVVLAGGKGSRMGALCKACPKPLLEVGGRPLLGHILSKLKQAGLPPHTVYVQPKDQLVTRFVQDELGRSDIEFLPCDREMGPFHWIRNVYCRVKRRILAVYGDFYATNFEIAAFLEAAERIQKPLVAAIGDSLLTTQAAAFGVDGSCVSSWTRKPHNEPGDLLNVGCYLIQHDERIDRAFDECQTFLEDDLFPKLIPNKQMGAYVVPGVFINVNTPDNLEAARLLA